MALTHEDDTQCIYGPHPPILQDLPDLLDCQSLTIMHTGLRGVVSEYSVDHDDLFPTNNHLQSHNQDLQNVRTYRSENHPFGLNHAFVCVGLVGIMKNDAMPMARVRPPSIRNR